MTWNKNRKLKWSDFEYNSEKIYAHNIYARVGISQRYHIDDKIEFRSKTLLIPEKSFVSDTLNIKALRIAQARFDLCEVYRRKLEVKVEILQKTAYEVTPDTLERYAELYYDKFEEEWSSFMKLKHKKEEKGLLNLEKQIKEQLNN